jgi:hypothetical protein
VNPRDTRPVSMLNEAIHAEPRIARYKARHAVRRRSKWKAAAAVAGAAGLITAIVTLSGAAPWSGGASPTADGMHDPNVSGHSSQFGSALTNTAKSAANDAATRNNSTGNGQKATTSAAPTPARSTSAASAPAALPAAKPATAALPTAKPTTAKPKPTTAKPTTAAKPTTSKVAASAQPSQKPAAKAVWTLFYDSVEPGAIPSGAQVATYSDGPYAQSAASLAGRGNIMWIDVNGGDINADALDVEPGDATPAGAAAWVSAKLTADPSSTPIVYTFKNDWGQVMDDIDALPTWMHSHVKYWIADPNGSPHILPGSDATQWYWGATYDMSSALPGFFS